MDETRTETPRQSGGASSADDLVSLPAGYPLARYQLLETLGQGSFGITYRAHDTQLNRTVAIKEYLPAGLAVRHGGTQVLPRSTRLADDFRWGRERFLFEAQMLARFENTPAVVRVYDFLEANGTAYMVMELLRGETLEDRLKRLGTLAPATLERLLRSLLDGLERVHATGILHRDIKPANITLDADDQPTLLDFGAARAAIAGRTQAMTAVYTPGYAAVEQFTSANQGPFTDIYALAATLYQCVTGNMPPTALERLMDDRLVPASRAAAGRYPAGLLAGIDAGLALKAADRPQTIAVWRDVFDGRVLPVPAGDSRAATIADASATRVSRDAVAVRGRRASRGWRRAIAAAVLVLMAGASVGGYLYVQDVRQRAALEQQRLEAERRAAEARQREAEAQRQAEAERLRQEAARRQAEEEAQRRAAEEARRQAQMEREAEDRRQEEAQRQAEAQQRQAEEARRRAEAEAQARRQQDEEARRRAAEEARHKTDADAQARRQQAEEARRRAAEDARRKAEADAQARRLQEEAAARRPAGVDGTWSGTVDCYPGGPKGAVSIPVAAGRGRTAMQGMKITMRISEGSVVSDLAWIGSEGREWQASLRGRPAGDTVAITGAGRTVGGRPGAYAPQCTMNLRRQ